MHLKIDKKDWVPQDDVIVIHCWTNLDTYKQETYVYTTPYNSFVGWLVG